jgi:hypothetical protein
MSIQEECVCPKHADLLRYAQKRLSGPEANQIRSHVDNRLICTEALERLLNFAGSTQPDAESGSTDQVIPEDLKEMFAQHSQQFQHLLRLARPEKYQFGQIWTTKLWNEDQSGSSQEHNVPLRIIVLLENESDSSVLGEPFLVAAPISVDIAYRSSYDLLVFEQESPLGYPFMIEVWNQVSPLHSQLVRYLGALQQPLKRFLGLVYQAHLGVPVDLGEIAQYLGPAILQPSDPRVHFQEQEIEECDYLRRPLLELLKRAEAGALEADRPRPVVLFQKKLPVIHDQPPLSQQKANLPLAAAEPRTQVLSHFIYIQSADGEIMARMNRDFRTDSLYLTWERLPQTLQGTTVSILLHTDTGETLPVRESTVRRGDRTQLSQGERLGPAQIESLSLEFRG